MMAQRMAPRTSYRLTRKRDDRIQFLSLNENRGMADARNCGIFQSTGRYVTFMDCDDVSLPERLSAQVECLESCPNIGAVGIGAKAVNHDLSTTLLDIVVPQQHCLIVLDMFVHIGFVYATMMIRREFLTAVGGCEPGRRTAADRELAARMLWETQIRYSNVPEILMLYRRHAQSMSRTRDEALERESRDVQVRMLDRLWNDAPDATLQRFLRMRWGQKLSWAERRATKRDLNRLIEALIASNWVEPCDRALLITAMNRRLQATAPRVWQMFIHWWRYRVQR